MNGIRILPLASSSRGNACLLTDGKTPLLLDAGINLKALRQKLPIKITDLTGVLATHEHGDHASGVKHLMGTGRDCYMTQGTADALGDFKHKHRLNIIKAKTQFQVGTWTIMPFDTVHDAAEPVGFLLTNHVKKILFVTDTAYIPYRFKGLTHICVECNYSDALLVTSVYTGKTHAGIAKRIRKNHMGLETLQRMLAANDLSKLEEIHLLHASDANSDVGLFKQEIQKQVGVPVYIADA